MKNRTKINAFFIIILLAAGKISAEAENQSKKYSICTTWHSFLNFESEEKNLQMYEFHFGYKLTEKDKLEIKAATWKLYEPLGIQMWDPHLFQPSEYYPGRLLEYGVGLAYQRTLWKGLFAAVEVLPLFQSYLVEGEEAAKGFRLYTSYHLGYHLPFFKDRMYIAPQVHCNYWPIMTDGPSGFKEKEDREWSKNYILFEPNIYIGVQF